MTPEREIQAMVDGETADRLLDSHMNIALAINNRCQG